MTRHLQQTKARDATDLNTGAILTHRIAQAVLHLTLVAYRRHIDEVDDDQAAQVAQAQLARDLIGRLQVGVKGGLFDIAAARGARGVDIDGGQRFGAVDNDRAAGGQTHLALEGGFDLRFDLIVAEQRDFTGVQFDLAAKVRAAQGGDMLLGQVEDLRVVDQDLADVWTQVVTEGADDDVAFLMDQERRRATLCGFLDGVPMFQAEREIPLQRIGRLADARGADDESHSIRDL